MSDTVKNRAELVSHGNREARALLLDVLDDAFDALRPERLLDPVLRRPDAGTLVVGETEYDLDDREDVYLVGVGKGSLALAEAVRAVLGDRLAEGLVVEKRGQARDADGLRVVEADHPLPSAASEAAAEAVVDAARRAGPDDLVVVCVTGGASALLARPPDGVSVEELATVTDRLLRAGAPIEDLNAVRKHVSRVKGGRLAELFAPAATAGLIVVDEVAGEPWGPTVPDGTTAADAVAALRAYDLWEGTPASVRAHLRAQTEGRAPDTPSAAPRSVTNAVLADAGDACEAAAAAAEARGQNAAVLSATVEGESADVAVALSSIAREVATRGRPFEPPCVLVSGGETTVTVPDDGGEGGPNQEFALAAGAAVEGDPAVTVAAVGTDGTDGPTDIAGGVADGHTVRRARERGVDVEGHLRRHDAATALRELGDAVYTRPTGTNVMDLRLFHVAAGDDSGSGGAGRSS